MYTGKKILAIIPARGGSKRIPKKNIVDIHGKPLLAYTVEAARQIPEIDKIVVSTEDPEISEVARGAGAQVLTRPAELAKDDTKDEPVLLNVLEELEKKGERYDYVLMLQVTSPMRTVETMRRAIDLCIDGDYDTVATVIEDRSYFRTCRNGVWEPVVPNAPRRTQEREPFYKEAGVIYVMNVQKLQETKQIFARQKEAFIIVSDLEGVDINTSLDLEFVRFLMQKK